MSADRDKKGASFGTSIGTLYSFGIKENAPSATVKGDSWKSIHPKIDTIFEGPSLLLGSQCTSAVLDVIKLNEGMKELFVCFGVLEVATEEGRALSQTVQTASSDHVKQLFVGERDGCGLNSARTIVQRADQP